MANLLPKQRCQPPLRQEGTIRELAIRLRWGVRITMYVQRSELRRNKRKMDTEDKDAINGDARWVLTMGICPILWNLQSLKNIQKYPAPLPSRNHKIQMRRICHSKKSRINWPGNWFLNRKQRQTFLWGRSQSIQKHPCRYHSIPPSGRKIPKIFNCRNPWGNWGRENIIAFFDYLSCFYFVCGIISNHD